MPYATPTTSPVLTNHSLGRPGHRRSYSSSTSTFSTERGPGAFSSLGSLPRRHSSSISINTAPKFHLNTSSGSSSSDSEPEDGPPPPLKLKKPSNPSFGGVPFPKTSPLNSPLPGDDTHGGLLSPLSGLHAHITGFRSPSPRSSPRSSPKPSPVPSQTNLVTPTPSRTSSSSILLSNGKPLKSSLKSSSSTSNIPLHHVHHPHHHPHPPPPQPTHHLRAQSAPSTPWEDDTSSSSPSSTSTSATNSPTTTPKNVHFPSLPTDLEHIRVFNKSAKPISFLRRSSDTSRGPNGHILTVVGSEAEGQETETETETDRDQSSRTWAGNGYLRSWSVSSGSGAGDRMGTGTLPFPRVPSPPQQQTEALEVDLQPGYSVPSTSDPNAFVVLESIEMKSGFKLELMVLVKNVAFEKQVVFRFTMDDWGTVSEVGGKFYETMFRTQNHNRTLGDVLGVLGGRCVSESALDQPQYDRFLITISLSDYLHLENRVMWGVVRYTCPGKGEWWDNNSGRNFRVGWKKVPKTTTTTTMTRERKPGAVGPGLGRSLSAPQPNVQKTQAQGEALQHRLSGFSLRNYVRPGTTKQDSGALGLHWSWGSAATLEPTIVTPGGSASVEILSKPGEDYFSPSAPSVTGPSRTSSISSTTSSVPGLELGESSNSSSFESLDSLMFGGSPPYRPHTHTKFVYGDVSLVGVDDDTGYRPGGFGMEDSLVTLGSPLSPPSPPSPSSGSETERPNSIVPSPPPDRENENSETLYKAFVKKWCFVESPRGGTPVTSPGSGGVTTGEGVKV